MKVEAIKRIASQNISAAGGESKLATIFSETRV